VRHEDVVLTALMVAAVGLAPHRVGAQDARTS
jgi:hypothetical protein